MRILLTNDDGYLAPGIMALYEALTPGHEVLLIAPDREKSGVSHSVTLNEPMRMEKVCLGNGGSGYRVCGTPADCVKLGLAELCPVPPDLVLSGINPGSNTGVNINYSGTVGAAREGALNGISSFAVSVRKNGRIMDFQGLARFMAAFIEKAGSLDLPAGTFLNINAPDIRITADTPVRITRQALDNVSDTFEKRIDPKSRAYYWYGDINRAVSRGDTDVHALFLDAVSITPIRCDMTDYDLAARLAGRI